MTTFVISPEEVPGEYDFDKPEDVKSFFANNDVFAVGKFNARNLVDFETHFGQSLDRAMATWYAATLYEEFTRASDIDETVKDLFAGVSYDAETNTYITPTGKLEMSPTLFALQILSFIFAQYGRVTDIDAKGNYVLEAWTYDNLLEIIDPDVAFAQVEDGGQNLFHKVAQLIRGFSMDDLIVEDEVSEDEGAPKPKNSRRSKSADKSTKDR